MSQPLTSLASPVFAATWSDDFASSFANSIAAIFERGTAIPLVAIIGGLFVGVTIAVSALYFNYRKQQMWHDTARIALEKGQPVPPMPLRDEELDTRPPPGVSFAEWHQARMAEGRIHDFKGGLILVAVGAALYLLLPYGSGLVGAIPGFIGLALLLNTLIQKLSARKSTSPEIRPPQA